MSVQIPELPQVWATRFGCDHPDCQVAYDNDMAAGVHEEHSPIFVTEATIQLQLSYDPVKDLQDQQDESPEPKQPRGQPTRHTRSGGVHTRLSRSSVVTLLVLQNPKKVGSAARDRWGLIETGLTVAQLEGKGVWYGDIRGGIERGWLKVE